MNSGGYTSIPTWAVTELKMSKYKTIAIVDLYMLIRCVKDNYFDSII